MSNRVESAYEQLLQAETQQRSIPPLTALYPELSVEEAYRVQLKMIDSKVRKGERIVGKKIGLTSLAMQNLLGVGEPDYGHLLNRMESTEDELISMEGLFEPRVEGEIAFVLKKDLQGPNVTVEEVLEATDYVVPSLEIVDSRITNWQIKLADTVADNASSGRFVLGKQRLPVQGVDLTAIEMVFYKNGEPYNRGSGKDVLGHPAACVAWLANKLHAYGVTLKAGEVILSGALSAAANAVCGDRFRAEFTQLGSVEATFG